MQPVRKVLFLYALTQQSVVLPAWLELLLAVLGAEALAPILGGTVDRALQTGESWAPGALCSARMAEII